MVRKIILLSQFGAYFENHFVQVWKRWNVCNTLHLDHVKEGANNEDKDIESTSRSQASPLFRWNFDKRRGYPHPNPWIPPPASASKSLLSWLKVRSQARSSCADGMSNTTFGAIQKRGVLSNYVINYYIFISLYYNIYFFIYSIYIIKNIRNKYIFINMYLCIWLFS